MEFPVKRAMIPVDMKEYQQEGIKVNVLSYNILAQSNLRREHFPYSSTECLKWSYRKNRILKELSQSNSDIICVQEIDSAFYYDFWSKEMDKCGYSSHFKAKTVQKAPKNTYGVAIFYNRAKFEEVAYKEIEFDDLAKGLSGVHHEEMHRSNVGQIIALKPKFKDTKEEKEENKEPTDRGLLIGNVHLFWHLKYYWVRLRQIHLMLEELISCNKQHNFSVILCGDLNSSPDTQIYKFLTQRYVSPVEYSKISSSRRPFKS